MEELSPTARLPADVEAAAQDPARRWGPFVLQKELGRGANGVVNLAYDLRLHRRVALKTLLEMSPVQFERFAREARAAAKLEHPSIVRILDLAMVNGRPYIAMEVVDGRSLRECFKEQNLRTRELVAILRDAAEALGHAHAQGIVHRDVKPGNIVVDATGRGKIMDFGIARDLEGDEALTATGQTLGTPEYMSPEQASDPRQVSPRSDVYSLGAVLFEGLTGRPPFVGSTPVETMFKVLSENLVRPSALSEVPMVLEEVILRCLDRDPGKRYAEGRELARALDRFLAGRAAMAAKKAESASAEGAAAPVARSFAIGIGVGAIVIAGVAASVVGYARWRENARKEAERVAAELGKQEERRRADAAQRDADATRKRAEESRRLRDAALAEAVRERDPRKRIDRLTAHLASEPEDVRALVARAAAANDLREDAAERGLATDEQDRAVARDTAAALALDPECGDAHFERARAALARGDADQATTALAAAEKTTRQPIAEVAALTAAQGRKGAELLARTEALVKAHPDCAYGWRLHALELALHRQTEPALEAYATSLKLQDRPRVHADRIVVLQASQPMTAREWRAVVAAATEWLESWPDTPQAYNVRARAAIQAGEPAAALPDAEKLRELGWVVQAHEVAAQARSGLKEYDAAIAECEALDRVPGIPPRVRCWSAYCKAYASEAKGDVAAAREHVLAAASLDDPSLQAGLTGVAGRVGNRLIRERGDPEAADQFFRQLGDTRLRSAQTSYFRQRAALYAGDLHAARQLLAEARGLAGASFKPEEDAVIEKCWSEAREKAGVDAAASRGDERARIERAVLDATLGERERANDELQRLAKEGSTPALRARALLARARHVVSAAPDLAERDIAAALELAPEDALALSERAVHRARTGKEAAAKEDLALAVARSPKDPVVHARRGEALLLLGDLEGAAAAVRRSLELDPRCWDALSVQLHVDRRRGDRPAEVADLKALLPFELYSIRADAVKSRIAWLEKGEK